MSDFWTSPTKPKARKTHKCDSCHRTIDPGETYRRGSGVWEDRWCSWKQCLHCLALLPRIDWDEGWSDEDYIEWEPADLEELRVKVHYNRKWRNNAGDLYPIPFEKAA